jgi:hypothetical protein
VTVSSDSVSQVTTTVTKLNIVTKVNIVCSRTEISLKIFMLVRKIVIETVRSKTKLK